MTEIVEIAGRNDRRRGTPSAAIATVSPAGTSLARVETPPTENWSSPDGGPANTVNVPSANRTELATKSPPA
jgi:hypothetical protein